MDLKAHIAGCQALSIINLIVFLLQRLAVAPLWDAANLQISGMLTSSDFIMILIEV